MVFNGFHFERYDSESGSSILFSGSGVSARVRLRQLTGCLCSSRHNTVSRPADSQLALAATAGLLQTEPLARGVLVVVVLVHGLGNPAASAGTEAMSA